VDNHTTYTNEVHTISSINQLPEHEKRHIYSRLIPPELIERFNIQGDFTDRQGNPLWLLMAEKGSPVAEMKLYTRRVSMILYFTVRSRIRSTASCTSCFTS